MAGEEKYLNNDLREVLKELSKAPGGNVPRARPIIPGPILGGPKEEYKPGIVDPATGVRRKADTAIELFRFYAFGETKERNIPGPPPDTKKVTVTEIPMSPEDKRERKFKKEVGLSVQQTELRRKKNIAIKQGTVGGMTRPIGSKPLIDLTLNMRAAIEKTAQMASRREQAEVIRAALEKAFGAVGSEAPEYKGKYTPDAPKGKSISREEQKYLDLLQRRIQDANLEREAALAEALAESGRSVPQFEEWKAMQEAEQRTLEGRQAAERTRISRQETERSLRGIPEKNIIKVEGNNQGKGTPAGDAKDIQMRKISNAAIVELVDIDTQNKIKTATPNVLGKSSSETTLLQLGPAGNNLSGKTIMLARNGKLSGQPLRPDTIAQITAAAKAGANFVVGDMPGVDSEFIRLLDEIKAPYKIYHTGSESRIKPTKIVPESKLPIPKGLGTGLASLDFISMILNANLMFEQMLLEESRRKKELQQPS